MLYNADMTDFCNLDYNMISGSHKCDCGKVHDFPVRCVLEHGAFLRLASFIADFTPPMSRLVFFYDNKKLMEEAYINTKKDFRILSINISDDKKQLINTALPEDTKLIVALGSTKVINAAKYKAYLSDIPVVIVALPDGDTLSSTCYIKDEGLYSAFFVNRPIGYIFDLDYKPEDNEKASLVGTIAARLNSSFEYYVSALLETGEYCPYIGGALSDIAAKVILSSDIHKASPKLNDILIEAALKQSILLSVLPNCGSEVQCGLTYAALTVNKFTQGELQFVFSAVLSALFKSYILKKPSFTPPPDNNYRLVQISELFGISENAALRTILPQISGRQAAITEYKIKEYAVDLLEKLDKNINLYRMAFKLFKRMYFDDGYSLRDLISADLSLSIALAPDIINGSGMLTSLKRLGELDRYIV